MSEVKVSVIISVYNAEKHLKKCIDSVLSQTLKDIEIIIVDDGSTDKSSKICDEYKFDDRVIVIHQKNSGAANARNTGLAIAKGEYIGFVDSDDFIKNNMFEFLFLTAKKYNCDIVNCGHYETDPQGNVIRVYTDTHGFNANSLVSGKEIYAKLINVHKDNLLWFTWRNIYRQSFVMENKIRFCEDDVVEDPLFNLDCFVNSPSMVFLDKPLYYYVQSDDSLTRKKGKIGYTKHLENTYNYKIKRYNENEIVGYKNDIDVYTVSHTVPMLITNLAQLNFDKNELNDLFDSKMIFQISYSNCRNFKDRLFIFLIKSKMKKVLSFILRIYFRV